MNAPTGSKRVIVGLVAALTATACSKDKADAPPADKAPAGKAPAPGPTPPTPTPPAPAATAPPADAYAQGYCEYAIDGGAPNKGGGGMSNVMSLHWMAADQRGRSLASQLLINCGAQKQVNLTSAADASATDLPMGPGTYRIGMTNKPPELAVLGPDFMGGEGELEITAWDTAHVAGAFAFTTQGKQYTGRFDLRCPYQGNGICP